MKKTRKMFIMILTLFSGFCFLLCGLEGCQTLPDQCTIEKDGKVYGVIKGLFQYRWWHYYERALSFADGKFWNEAELDLREAIMQRKNDQRRARTYGMHFINYFPHRELGVVHYNQGRMEYAISELTASLSAIQSSKAELYLDRARRAMIEKGQIDQRDPEIIIKSPAQPFLTNAFSIVIHGLASDDTFVSYIKVGNKEVRVDVSNQEIPFRTEVQLAPGRNEIPVVVKDLTGKVSRTVIMVNVDRTGPAIRIDEAIQLKPFPQREVLLKGFVFDDSGLSELVVNGCSFLSGESQQGIRKGFRIERVISFHPEQKEVAIKAGDLAGNLTIAVITPKQQRQSPPIDTTAPVIELRNNLRKEQVTYLDHAIIEGCIKDNDRVERLFVNGKQILNAPGRKIYFSCLIGLNEGKNSITIKGIDSSGNSEEKHIKISRIIVNIQKIGSRLRVGVNTFKKEIIGINREFSHGIEDILEFSIRERGRFSISDKRAEGRANAFGYTDFSIS